MEWLKFACLWFGIELVLEMLPKKWGMDSRSKRVRLALFIAGFVTLQFLI